MSLKVFGAASVYEVYQSKNSKGVDRLSRAEEKKDIAILSSHAKDYQVAAKAVRNTSDVRVDKVSEIQKRIESGNYNVSSNDIAGKILGAI